MTHSLTWKKFHPLTDQNAFICLVDHMGDDSSIVQAARVSYGKDKQEENLVDKDCKTCDGFGEVENPETYEWFKCKCVTTNENRDRNLIRYLLNHGHTTPFEMVEIKFMVQVPMDCWRQWIRHRTANVNEYSTRYTEALDIFQVTDPTEWRLQATDNKQGSSGYLEKWPENWNTENEHEKHPPQQPIDTQRSNCKTPGQYLTQMEENLHDYARETYQERLSAGIAKEQARKDLPLSTYTRAYWKCDLHNIFNFLRLRMDSHAQLEIRQFANCMFEIVKQLCPVACEAFEDYVLHANKFSRMEMEQVKQIMKFNNMNMNTWSKPDSMTDREWKEFLEKLS